MKMNFSKIFASLILLIGTLPNHLQADGMVYKVSKGPNHLYLAGTLHLLRGSDYPLPVEYETAYRDSKVIGYEIDPDLMATPDAQAAIMKSMMLPKGEALHQKLTPETYKALVEYANTQGLSKLVLDGMQPSAAILIVAVTGLGKLGVTPDKGIEMFYNLKANSDKKQEFSLETLAYQLDIMMGMAEGQEDAAVRYTLESMKTLEKDFDNMVSAWRKGNGSALHEMISAMMEKEYPKMYDRLIVKRNKEWIPQIKEKLATPAVETILVGAAHLAGPDSVIAMLKKEGYTITQLQTSNKKP